MRTTAATATTATSTPTAAVQNQSSAHPPPHGTYSPPPHGARIPPATVNQRPLAMRAPSHPPLVAPGRPLASSPPPAGGGHANALVASVTPVFRLASGPLPCATPDEHRGKHRFLAPARSLAAPDWQVDRLSTNPPVPCRAHPDVRQGADVLRAVRLLDIFDPHEVYVKTANPDTTHDNLLKTPINS